MNQVAKMSYEIQLSRLEENYVQTETYMYRTVKNKVKTQICPGLPGGEEPVF